MAPLRSLLALLACAAAAAQQHTATRLRIEYLDSPLTIDVPTPRFSYALAHPARAQLQTSTRITVSSLAPPALVWDSGTLASNVSLNIAYGGPPLSSDTDYSWTVVWADAGGALSAPATATFSTALLSPAAWQGAEWLSSPLNGSLNTYRAQLTLPAAPTRARLYVHGLGYAKTWLNGALTDEHELGTFTTFQKRTLYDVVDVTAQLRAGCNALGVMLGHGWFAQPHVHAGDRQFRLLLSVTLPGSSAVQYFASSGSASGGSALAFVATAGPVLMDDIYEGETYSGVVAAQLAGWTECGFVPAPGAWVPTEPPAESPSTFGSIISAHNVHILTDRDYSVVSITQPPSKPGTYVFDMGQNMAGQSTLRVEDCPANTTITLIHNEILNVDGTVNRNLAKMLGTYICGGTGVEIYRTQFTYYGFRYVQVDGFPGVPGENAVTAHFVHSDVPQSGEFSSSSTLLNAIQHATRYASWSNLMDIPTDCPQRERFGWLGDAQLSFETVIHNVDAGGFYTKWLNDFADTQEFDNVTMGTQGALPDCIPFYGHGHPDADPGWGIAAWTITDWFSDYYADDVFDVAWYPHMKWYMTHWINITAATPDGIFPIFHWGDWANYVPGPYAFKTPEYPMFFYVRALEITAKFAARLGQASDAAYYSGMATAARALYKTTFFNATTGCYAGCTYVSQVLALTLGLAGPQGSPEEVAVWARAMDWWAANATQGVPEHFGGGIISLKLAYPLLDAHGETGLALRMHLQTDRAPGFGYWITTGGATTLWEAYDMTATEGGDSRNHIMFGGVGNWYFSTLAGLDRAPGSRSWQDLVIRPPGAPEVLAVLNFAGASIDSTMGLVASSWTTPSPPPKVGDVCGEADEAAKSLTLTCASGAAFTGVAFASFGTPTGTCAGGLAVNPACHANTSAAVVAAACVGKSSCTIPVTVAAFGGVDPCYDTVKSLAVSLNGPGCTVFKYTASATVPVGARAQVHVPVRGSGGGSAASASVTEGGATVWAAGAFVPGVPGVSAGAASADGSEVVFSVGSGVYDFAATE